MIALALAAGAYDLCCAADTCFCAVPCGDSIVLLRLPGTYVPGSGLYHPYGTVSVHIQIYAT
jgi:hypothetical protein